MFSQSFWVFQCTFLFQFEKPQVEQSLAPKAAQRQDNQSQLKSGLSQLSELQKSNSCGLDVLSANSALKL